MKQPAGPHNFSVVLVKLDGGKKLVLMTGGDGCVSAFSTETQAVRHFEDAYARFHARSYESSMSACLHSIFYWPSVVTFASRSAMLKGLGVTNPKKARIVESQTVCGGMTGVLLESSKAKKLWEKGVKPRLAPQGY